MATKELDVWIAVDDEGSYVVNTCRDEIGCDAAEDGLNMNCRMIHLRLTVSLPVPQVVPFAVSGDGNDVVLVESLSRTSPSKGAE